MRKVEPANTRSQGQARTGLNLKAITLTSGWLHLLFDEHTLLKDVSLRFCAVNSKVVQGGIRETEIFCRGESGKESTSKYL